MGLSEDKLKDYILSKYKSMREFTGAIDMPYSTVDSIFKRGIRKASVDNVIKICDFLNISTDALINGSIEPKQLEPTTIALHFDGNEYTEDELDEINQFAEFVKNKRK
jgi:hypothetical protein